jgi:hypothetical protein
MRRRYLLNYSSSDTLPPSGVELPPGMDYHELPADSEKLEFWGRFIDKTDTDDGENDRWAELQYWFILDTDPSHDGSLPEDDPDRGMFGKQLRLVYTIGHSLVWHRYPGGCNKGVKVLGREFPASTTEDPDSLMPCERCHPGDWEESPDTEFRLEKPWYSYSACRTPQEAITALSRCANCRDKPHEGVRCYRCGCTRYTGVLTTPGRTLVTQLAKVDPELAQAASKARKF